MGTWVEIRDYPGSWQWRHWYATSCFLLLMERMLTEFLTRGCVSGEQCVNMQKTLGRDEDGEYRWDYIDGWEELE